MIIPTRLHNRVELLSRLRFAATTGSTGAPLQWFVDAKLTDELAALRADVADTITKLSGLETEVVRISLNPQAKTLTLAGIDAEGVKPPMLLILRVT